MATAWTSKSLKTTPSKARRSFSMGLSSALILTLLPCGVARAQKVVQPNAGAAGTWKLIGQTHADHGADHDTIIVKGPFDNFRKIKFKVTDAPLNMQHMVVTYDNGAPDKIEIRQNIAQGGESRAIDLRGIGKRSIAGSISGTTRKGFLKGKADVTVFGMK